MTRAVADYQALVPQANAGKPNFMAMLAATLQPLADSQSFAAELSEAFDLDSAMGVQLDAVGLWVGVSRKISVPIQNAFFSWNTPGLGWNQGDWLGPYITSNSIVSLDDNAYRFLLYARIAANHWDGTAETADAAYALALTGTGATARVQDNADGTATVYISGTSSVVTQALISGGYVPLKPIDISVNYVFQ